MTAIRLTPHERKAHRADAHHLEPVVMIGSGGLTPAVLKEADAALKAHGLIKVRVFSDERDVRERLLVQLCDTLHAAPVQHIGKLLVLWRPLPEKEKAEREDRMAGPKVVKVLKFPKSGNHRPQIKRVTVYGNERVTASGTLKKAKVRQASQKKRALSE
jgi:putative YhbY family RNA-binding protein